MQRRRKSRCVLENSSPICVLCRFHGQECTFVHDPQSRKRKPPEDEEPRGEKRRSAQSQFFITCADKHFRQSISSVRTKKSPENQTRVIQTTNGTGVEEYDDLDGPSLLKRTLGLQNKNHSQYIGATRGLEPALLGPLSMNGTGEVHLSNGAVRRVSMTEAFLVLPDPETQGYEDELDDLDAIEAIIKPHGKSLVGLYFRIVFPSFPILHKEVYLEKYRRSYREFSPPLLAAVYLLALQYWSYDDNLSEFKKPDTLELEKLARKALGDTIHRPKLSTVQAGLLLLQHTDTDSAELTAQLVSVGYGLGLHLDASEWNIPSWEKGLRKRLGWGLYMQDKWSSLGSGRPTLINSSNWALQPVANSDFPENSSHEDDQEGSAEVEKGRILFGHMISLSEILSDILESIFTVKMTKTIANAGNSGLSIVLEKAKPVQLRLKEWFSSLPACLSMDVTSVMKLSSVGYLRLAYVATEITLHRRIILALSPSTDPQLQRICRSVAHERFMFAIDFVQSLKPQHLSSFWYFASAQNLALVAVFGTLLLSTAGPTETDFYKTKLREYRWTLKINSENGARFMKPAMALLDANMALLNEGIKSRSIPLSPEMDSQCTAMVPNSNRGIESTVTIELCDFFDGIVSDVPGYKPFGDFAFDTPYYPGQNTGDGASPSGFVSVAELDHQEFGFGNGNGGDSTLWNY